MSCFVVSSEVLFPHGFIAAHGASKPGRGDLMLMHEVRLELMLPFGAEGAPRAGQPLDADAMFRGEVDAQVLFGAASKVAVRTAKGGAIWP